MTRVDLSVYNEACGLSAVTTAGVIRVVKEDIDDPRVLTEANQCVAIELYQDDSYTARVVVGELSEQEEEEWIGRVTRVLEVPDGKLLVVGGFDPSCFHDHVEDGESEFVNVVDVPPGTYQIDVYTYLCSVNSDPCLDAVDEDLKLGAWFRATRPDTPFPEWLAANLHEDCDHDPGHEDAWGKCKQAVAEGKLAVARSKGPCVDFLFQLRPIEGEPELTPIPGEEGWFDAASGARKPARFPLGIESTVLEHEDGEGPLSYVLDRDDDDDDEDLDGLDDMRAEITNMFAALDSGEVVLEGKVSKFLKADPERPPAGADLQADADAMGALGFQPLGGMICERFGDVVMYGFAAPTGHTYGVCLHGTLGQGSTDFYTDLSDGSSLTTTLNAGEGDQPAAKIYKRSYPNLGLAELLEKHEEGVAELATEGVEPVPAEPSLEGLASAVDGFLKRMGM